MLSIEGLAYRHIADTRVGNLIYVVDNDAIQLALCVEHPPLGPGRAPARAALRLTSGTRHGRMPVVDTGVSRCIDWGARPEVRWEHPLTLLPRNSQQPATVGYIVLIGDQPAVSSCYSSGRGDLMYWNVLTGKSAAPGEADFILVTKWTLGVKTPDGSFLPLASYPGDYGEGKPRP